EKRSFAGLLSRSDRTVVGRVESTSSGVSSLSLSAVEKGDLGLTTLYAPEDRLAAVADIIFVHGLGGGSRKTWTFSKDDYHYWPQSWLPSDPDFKDVRIHVFGYNADWTKRQQSMLNIHDFAQSLLGEMKHNPIIRRDNTSIILVGHSMGGCVAKKTYILARQDPTCKPLADRIQSMFFLGTPHRGSDLALILENILTMAWGRKPFVKDLLPNSTTLTEINDAFRHCAPNLNLWSFYETQPIKTSFMNKLIVDKLSSTLGYPHEEIAAMNADHRHVCKFESPADSNYRLLRNSLHTAVDNIRALMARDESAMLRSQATPGHTTGDQSAELLAFFDLGHAHENDFATLQDLKEPGSCAWFNGKPFYKTWADGTGSQILWLTGRPGAGKSVMSSHVADELQLSKSLTSYFIFKHGKNNRSTLSDCFRSIAYQTAIHDAFVRDRFLQMAKETLSRDMDDETIIWRRLFIGVIFQSPMLSQHAWVIDGIDECSNFNSLFTKKFLAATPLSLRIFATSRDLDDIGRGLAVLDRRVHIHALSEEDTVNDIRLFLSTKLTELGRFEFPEKIEAMCNKILHKSRGSFLWVRLVMQDFEVAWTEEAMESILHNVPADLEDVYLRILQSIEGDPHKKMLAKSILTWVVLASRPLSLKELRCAIQLDVNQTLLNIAKAVPNLCGQLLFIDQNNNVQIIHETVREFLMATDLESDLAVPRAPSHTRLAKILVRYLSSPAMKAGSHNDATRSRPSGLAGTRTSSSTSPDPGLLPYAVYFFSDHVYRSTSEDDLLMKEICMFLESQNVLSWIEQIARGRDLGQLTRTAANLRNYLARRANFVSPMDPDIHVLDGWVVDLIRVAAKFRPQLVACPSAIHCLIPPLCPPESSISSTFAKEARLSPLIVKNLPDGGWDDCLIRIDFTKGLATAVAHGDIAFAVGLSTGRIILYSSVSLQHLREFTHPERVRMLLFSQAGEYLLSCGNKHLRVWDVRTGAARFTADLQSPPLSAVFLNDTEILTTSDASEVTKWDLDTENHMTESWLGLDEYELSGNTIPDQSPTNAAFSGPLQDHDVLLAVAYRSYPVLVWDPMEMQLLGKCEAPGTNGVDDMLFNPNPDIPALVVSYSNGSLNVFNYISMTPDSSRSHVYANSISCSKDGRSLVCGTSQGSIHLYEFDQGYDGEIFLTPIYRINALEESIRGLAFHFNGLRFVDITRRQCRVWEPAALVRRDNEVENLPQISTSLVTSADGHLMAAGNSHGQVTLFSTHDGIEVGTAYSHNQGAWVKIVALSNSGTFLASADDSGRVLVAELPREFQAAPQTSPDHHLASNVIINQRIGAVVTQLAFSPDASRLLVTTNSMELWELPTGKVLHKAPILAEQSSATEAGSSAKPPVDITPFVTQHPSKPDHFIVMAGGSARVLSWVDLTEPTTPYSLQAQYPASLLSLITVKTTCLSVPGIGVLEHRSSQTGSSRLTLWPTSIMDGETDNGVEGSGQQTAAHLEALSPRIHSLLGVISGTKVAFLDTNFWVCSFDLRPSPAGLRGLGSRSSGSLSSRRGQPAPDQGTIGNIRRHFFAMSEWRDSNSNLSCLMVPSRTRPTRNASHDFAFIARDRVILVQGGLDFAETITASSATSGVIDTGGLNSVGDSPARWTPSQPWTVVSGSMHRRASNW
ncbi:NACHT and WD domain-containing protein, partial [Plectosphaerella plurivora]